MNPNLPPEAHESKDKANIEFEDIFNLEDIQRLQDLFAEGNGVASLITKPDGTPITKPSNFCRLCSGVVRMTKLGLENCIKSDISLETPDFNAPVLHKCLSAGLWDAKAAISINGVHIAFWHVGQVRNSEVDEAKLLNYGAEIGADPKEVREAYLEVPIMSVDKFQRIADMLFIFANELSEKAYTNLLLKKEISKREKTELALRQSEENFKAIANYTASWEAWFNKEGKLIWMNPYSVQITGFTPEEYLSAENFMEFSIFEDDLKLAYEKLSLATKGIGGENLEVRVNHINGSHKWVSISWQPIFDSAGNSMGFRTTTKDISKQKLRELEIEEKNSELDFMNSRLNSTIDNIKTTNKELTQAVVELNKKEKALRESEERYKSILNASPDVITITDIEGKIIMVTNAGYSLFGYPKEAEILGHSILDFIAPQDRALALDRISQLFQGIKIGLCEYKALHRDQTIFDVEVNSECVRDDEGQPIQIVFVIRDITESKKASQALLRSEENYSILFQNSPNAYLLIVDGIFTNCNTATEIMLGATRNQIIGQRPETFSPEFQLDGLNSRCKYLDMIALAIANGHNKFEWTHCKLDKTNFEVEVSLASMIFNEKQTLFVTWNDISARKLAEQNVLKTSQHYHALIENAPDGIALISAQGEFKYMSPSGKKILGYNEWDNIGLNQAQLTYSDDLPLVMSVLNKIIECPADVSTIQYRLVDKKGNWVWVESTFSNLLNNLSVEAIVLNFKNITERKQIEEAMLDSISFQQVLLDAVPLPIFYKDANSRYIGANKEFMKFMGVTLENFIGKTGYELVPSELAQKYEHVDDKLLKNPGSDTYEISMLHADGKMHDVVFNKATYDNTEGNIAGIVGVMLDITERKLMEVNLRHASRLYAFLSQVNQAIVQTSSEEELFDKICQVAIESGQFLFAWIGLVDSKTHELSPTVFAGKEDGYLSQIVVTTDQSEFAKGSSGRAFVDGIVAISSNIEDDPDMLPWREEALARGYRSSAGVPIKNKDAIIGVLSLYSSEVGFFNKEETQLLQEISDDISYALDAIVSEKERVSAVEALQINNSRLELAMQSAKMAWWEMDIKTGDITFEKRKAEMLGYAPDKFKHYTDFKILLHPDDIETATNSMLLHIKGKTERYEVEYRILTQTGEYKWFYDVGSVTKRDENGAPVSVSGLIKDITLRKQTEEELSKQRQFFEQMFIQSSVSTQILDAEGWCERINPKLSDLFGVMPNNIEGKVYNIFEDKAIIENGIDKHLERVFHHNETAEWEVLFDIGLAADSQNIKIKENKSVWFFNRAYPILDKNGSVSHVVIQHTDITQHKMAEEAIKDSEQRYRALFQNSRGIMLLINPQSDEIIDANDAACEYYGYTKEQILSMKIGEINTLSPAKLKEEMMLSIDKNKSHFFFKHRLSSGEIRDVEVYSGPVIINNKELIYSLIHDISERRNNEREILKTNSLLKSILESSPEIIVFALDKDYRFLTYNSKYKNHIEVTEGVQIAKGMNLIDVFKNKQTRESTENNIDRALTGENFSFVEDVINADNSTTTWLNYWSQIIDQEGCIVGVTCFMLNVTERKQVELIKEKNKELTVANADKDRFMSILAHDLKSPFNSILGYLQFLSTNVRKLNIDEIDSQIDTIYTSAKHAYKLLEEILMWARTQSGKLPFAPETWTIDLICKDIIGDLKLNAASKNISLSYKLEQKDISVYADLNMVKTILRNLVSNGIKFTNRGGRIEIGAKMSNSKNTLLTVTDTGIGIQEKVLLHLFDITNTITTLGTAEEKGTGLGLLLCREFVEKHGGTIWAESSVGVGTTFYISFPTNSTDGVTDNVTELKLTEDNDTLQTEIEDVKNINILIVENCAPEESELTPYFGKLLNNILYAKTSAEAIELCKTTPHLDVVFMDMRLPDGNGYDTTKQIRVFNKAVVIIAQTPFALSGVREKALDAGCTDYCPKPFTKDKLLAIIGKYIK